MDPVITATYENGVLKPDQALNLPPQARVRLLVLPGEFTPEGVPAALDELDALCEQFPIDSGSAHLTRDQLHERR